MSSPHISFRLNHYHLAKALRILVTLEPNQPIASLSQAMKIIIIDWISKHSINTSLNTSQADIEAIKIICSLPVEQIEPYSTIQNIMAQAKQQSPKWQPNQPVQQLIQKSVQQIQRDLEDERIFNEIKQEAIRAKQISAAQTEEQIATILQEAPAELSTGSVVTTVKDFSPPKEWADSES